MRITLWDTRKCHVSKDFAGGFGVGQNPNVEGLLGQVIRWGYKRDYRPASLHFAYLASVMRKLGHQVEYVEDDVTQPADVFIFNPSLMTLALEIEAIDKIQSRNPNAKILITGSVAYALPDAFQGNNVIVVRGECERLLDRWDEVLAKGSGSIDVGSVRELDDLPFPDWSPFDYQRFRVAYDFNKFPTGFVQQSRGCTYKCNYCPYIMVESKTRFRSPDSVIEELQHGIERYGFRSFKFRDPLFGLDKKRVYALAEKIGRLPRRIQFSIESRIDLLPREILQTLREVGLTSITVGVETPDENTLRTHKRVPIKDDRQRDFVELCRGMGIRTVAGFMIGFPHDTKESIRDVARYAMAVGPTFANFNVVTPYPGTEYFEQVRDQIASFDFSQYNVFSPVMKYEHLTAEEVKTLHGKCFKRYYFRWRYLRENAHLLWPSLRIFGVGKRHARKLERQVASSANRGAQANTDAARTIDVDQAHGTLVPLTPLKNSPVQSPQSDLSQRPRKAG